jgi:carbon monoxide dehydrogenase subunit G
VQIAAERVVPAEREAVFAFLSDLENHWLVADRFVEVLELEGPPGARHGGAVRVLGPLGLGRTAVTRVEHAEAPSLLMGRAEIGRSTTAQVKWTLDQEGEGTRVALFAAVERAGPIDRVVLALGGRRWLEARFRGTLENLAAVAPSLEAAQPA